MSFRPALKPVLAAVAACWLALPAFADDERGVVLLTGNVWADGARSSIEGRAMVCNLAGAASFLSLRTGPDPKAVEIAKLGEMTIIELTGEVQGKWAKAKAVVYEVANDGNLLPEENRGLLTISGWVHSDYLCNYMY